MKKLAKMLVCLILSCILALPQAGMIPVWADDSGDMVTDVVKCNVTDTNAKNYFAYTAYSGKNWTILTGESYIDLGTTDARAEECYYEIHFEGNAISVTATKQPNHGKVKFILDGETEQVVDLYSASKTNEVVYSADGLTEGGHVLRAVTQTDKTGGKIVNQVICAEITHEPYKGGTPSLGGTIEDTNWQYTQDRYGEISSQTANDTAELTAWKNDKATSEIVLYSKSCSLENVSISTSALQDAYGNTIPAENVKTVFVKSAKAYNANSPGYGDPNRPYPEATAGNRSETSDILYQEGGSVDMAWNSLQPVWVEFNIPKDAKAGTYIGKIRVMADGIEKPLAFTYKVRVQDVVLPDASAYADTFDIELWQYPYSNAEYYDVTPFSEEHLELLRSTMLKYKEIGGYAITATIVEEAWSGQTYSKNEIHYPSMVKWTKEADGSFQYDYSDFDKWIEFCRDEIGIGDKIVLYSIAPWHNSFTYWEDGEMKKVGFTAGSDDYNQIWGDFLRDLMGHLEEKGWFEDSYIGIDERGFNAKAFDLIESITNEDGECFKTAGAMDKITVEPNRSLAMRVTDLNVGDSAAQNHSAEFAQLLADRKAEGLRTTLYSCTEHKPGNFSLSMPAESYWSIINAGKKGTGGFLRWAYDAWVEDPLRDTTHNAFEAGDCFLIFPDEKDAENRTSKSSIRLERMAEGVRDVNKLMLIERERPELAEQIRQLYEEVETVASLVSYGGLLNDSQRTQLAREMTAFKAGVAEITDQYLKAENKPGVYPDVLEKTLKTGEKWQISAETVGTGSESIVYKSKDVSVATVDADGFVTARGMGSTDILLKAGEYTAAVRISVEQRDLPIANTLTDYKLPEEYLSDVLKGPQTGDEHYLGQPDMIMLDDEETLYTAIPVGHGKGRIVMMVSHDAGDSWERKTDIPKSWGNSYETPTLYKLSMTDGSTKLILISGRPANFGAPTGGWDTSISTDDGETWSEFETYCEYFEDGRRNDTVVAMASLVQLKENGEYIDKWMGVYHDGNTFENYKTYLTFDEEGNQQWSEPEPYLKEYRDVERRRQICEVGMFRSPDGNRIVALARNQSHAGPATMFYSDDEGDTWCCPIDLPGSLAGERHKVLYDPNDPTGQRIICPFREIQYDKNGDGQFGGGDDWMAGDWVAWVGTYDDLMNGRDGSYRILLCEDWAANRWSGDTGYSGFVVQSDGTFIMDTYGHWDKEYSQSLKPYNVHDDWCWIKQAKFKLSEMDQVFTDMGQEAAPKLEEVFNGMPALSEASKYTEDSWTNYSKAYQNAAALNGGGTTAPGMKYYEAISSLQTAYQELVMKRADEIVDLADLGLTDAVEITLNKKEVVLKAGDSEKLTATVEPADMASQYVKWQSSDTAVAEVDQNGMVTAVGSGTAVITVTSLENDSLHAQISVKVGKTDEEQLKEALETAKKDLESVVSAADAVINAGKKDYSEESWNAFLKAYKEAEEGKNSSDPAKLKSLMEALDAAQKALTSGQGGSGDLKEFELDGCKYEVIDAAALTVKLVQGKDAGNVTVDTIEQNGKTYTVTVICSKAFNSCKTLKTVTIGANIVQIEKNAFYNCKKLKTIKFKAKKKLPSMAKKAFNKTKAKPTVKVQKALRKNAKIKQKTFKALKKAGLKITVKNIK